MRLFRTGILTVDLDISVLGPYISGTQRNLIRPTDATYHIKCNSLWILTKAMDSLRLSKKKKTEILYKENDITEQFSHLTTEF